MLADKKINLKTMTKTIVLTITEACNLNCIYCYEDYKCNKSMDFKTAISIIDNELRQLPKDVCLDVSYIGGEPFLNFDLIKRVYEYYEQKNVKNIKYTCSSNGTLVHGEIKEWVKTHFPKFSYNLSLDGIKCVQDYNRSNSFDMIDLEFYLELYKDKSFVKMTLHPDTIGYLAESVKYMHSLGIHVVANCAYGVDWTDENTLNVYKEQLVELIAFYLDNPNLTPCSILSQNINVLAYETSYKPWCGIDKMTVFDVKGKGFPCHFFQDVTLGKELASNIPKLDYSNLVEYMDEECKKCKFISICPTCLGSNYKANGCFGKRDMNVCKTFKLQLYANALLNFKKIEKYGLANIGLNEVEQMELYKGICKIQEFIDPEKL